MVSRFKEVMIEEVFDWINSIVSEVSKVIIGKRDIIEVLVCALFTEAWLSLFVLKLTGFVAVAGVLGILAWIGYTLATTPPPKPIEEIEKELEEELNKLEKETKQETQKTEEKEEKKESTDEENK